MSESLSQPQSQSQTLSQSHVQSHTSLVGPPARQCYERLYNTVLETTDNRKRKVESHGSGDNKEGESCTSVGGDNIAKTEPKRSNSGLDSSTPAFRNRYQDAVQYGCAGVASSGVCQCSQEILRTQMDPSLNKIISAQEPLMHHNGYVIPKHSELDVLHLAKLYGDARDKNIVFYDPPHNPVHKYVLKGKLVGISCTGFVGQYHSHFDAKRIIPGMIEKPAFPKEQRYEKYRNLYIYVWPESGGGGGDVHGGPHTNPKPSLEHFPSPAWQEYFASADKYAEKLWRVATPEPVFQKWQLGMVPYTTIYKEPDQIKLAYYLIKNMWDENAFHASGDGTALHYSSEIYANEMYDHPAVVENTSIEFGYVKTFFRDMQINKNVSPYRTEQIIYDEDYDFAGSVDLQMAWLKPKQEENNVQVVQEHIQAETTNSQNIRDIILIDHKRSREIRYESFGDAMMYPPLDEFPDTNFFHYTTQLNLYAHILEKHYRVRVVEMYLSIFHPNKENYQLLPVNRRQDLVKKMFQDRVNALYL